MNLLGLKILWISSGLRNPARARRNQNTNQNRVCEQAIGPARRHPRHAPRCSRLNPTAREASPSALPALTHRRPARDLGRSGCWREKLANSGNTMARAPDLEG